MKRIQWFLLCGLLMTAAASFFSLIVCWSAFVATFSCLFYYISENENILKELK